MSMTEKPYDCDGARKDYDKLTLYLLEHGRPEIVQWNSEELSVKVTPVPWTTPGEWALSLTIKEATQAGHLRCLGEAACQVALNGESDVLGPEN